MGSLHEKQVSINNSFSHILSTPEKYTETTAYLSGDITNRFKHILVFKLLLFLLWRYLDHLPIFVWPFLFMSVIVHKLSGEPLKSAELSHTIDTISFFGRRVLGKTNLKETQTQPRSRAYSFWSWVALNVHWHYAMKLAYGRKLMEISVLTEKFQLEGFLGT